MAKSGSLLKIVVFFIGTSLACLSVSHSQSGTTTITPEGPTPQQSGPPLTITTPAPNIALPGAVVTPPLPGAAALPGTAAPTPATTPINVDGLLNSDNSSGKYSEYQSICRTHEFDEGLYQPDDIVTKNKTELKTKAEELLKNNEKTVPKTTYQTIKGLVDYGEFDLAKKVISSMKAKSLTPQDINLLNAFGAVLRRNLSEARQLLVKELADDKDNEFVLTLLGEIYMTEKNFYEASAIYEDLNKKTSDKYLPLLCEATVLNSFNTDGEKICMLAAKKFRDNPFPLIFAGISTRERLDNRKALAYFRLSLKTRPTEMGHICLAELSLIERKLDEAIESFKLSAAVAPKSPRALLGLAAAQMSAHKYDDAYETYRKVCKLSRRYEIEIRRAYKKMTEEKIPSSERFMRLAETCGN